MLTDTAICAAADSMLASVNVPPVSISEILGRAEASPRGRREWPVFARPAIAAAAVVAASLVVFPSVAPAVVQSVEAQYRAALQALGGHAPPSAPAALVAMLIPQPATLAQAQARVDFRIVPPSGLPSDVVSSSVHIAPVGFYARATHAWGVGEARVSFAYHRTDGREFVLNAAPYDANDPPPHYVFEAKDPAPDGRPVLIRHELFAWRNGNQVLTAIAGSDISATEIVAIQSAMHGTPVARRAVYSAASGPVFFRVLRKP
jgi:hypothetical protein